MKIIGTAEEIRIFKGFAQKQRLDHVFDAYELKTHCNEVIGCSYTYLDKELNLIVADDLEAMASIDNELLLKRFRHLLQSETISKYDEVDPLTGKYKNDIKELDLIFKEKSKPNILYICDHRACASCSNSECNHTSDIRHAMNFELLGRNFWEKELIPGILCSKTDAIPEDSGKETGPT